MDRCSQVGDRNRRFRLRAEGRSAILRGRTAAPLRAGHWRRAHRVPMSSAGRLRRARKTQLIYVLTLGFVIFFLIPVAVSAILYLMDDRVADWKTADRSGAGLLRPAGPDDGAVVRVFSVLPVRCGGVELSSPTAGSL